MELKNQMSVNSYGLSGISRLQYDSEMPSKSKIIYE